MVGRGGEKQTGFTIVELLVVIVVIAIIAAISVVAYSGIQQRSQNTQTVAAVRDWSQALQLYKTDKGSYPTMVSCLGSGYGRGFSGTETSGGQCRQDTAASGGISENSSFTSLLSEYMSGNPTPAFVTAGSSDHPWFRGAYFYPGYTNSRDRIDFVLAGSSTECPVVAGMVDPVRQVYYSTNSVRCILRFPDSEY